MVLCAFTGVCHRKIAYKPLRNATRIAALITAIGVSLFLEYSTMFAVKATVRTYPQVFKDITFKPLNGVVVNIQQVFIFTVTIVLMILLQYIVHKTKIGKAMRAVSTDKDAAQLMGINVDKTISFTFAIGSAPAGAAAYW